MLCAWSSVNHCDGLTAILGRSMLRHGVTARTSSSTAARIMEDVRL
ncbi:hypothetical protein A4G23_04393 [Streptomyces rubrolavendulae]|uniref:Uncharacterized protein n=1 Tax=Streptomyces rubrolavendulae TaxID=285473 RepID=A0A1D8G7S7_9ACTN|nr:hypothetical protein A4G23_04393 [Streptomyces rubrolavendulae]